MKSRIIGLIIAVLLIILILLNLLSVLANESEMDNEVRITRDITHYGTIGVSVAIFIVWIIGYFTV